MACGVRIRGHFLFITARDKSLRRQFLEGWIAYSVLTVAMPEVKQKYDFALKNKFYF